MSDRATGSERARGGASFGSRPGSAGGTAQPAHDLASAPHPAGDGRLRAYGMLVLCFLFWSNSFTSVRALVGDGVPDAERLAPLELVVVRGVPVALWCLGWFALVPAARRAARTLLADRPGLIVLLAALGVWAYNLAFAAGHHRVAAGTGSLITALNPALTFLLAALFGLERPTARQALGLAVAFGGIYVVVVYGAGHAIEPAYVQDALILLLAPLAWSFYTVLSKPLVGRHAPLHLTFLILGIANLPTLPLALSLPSLQEKVALWGYGRHAAALFLALFCTVIGFWLWYEALRHLSASTTAAFVFLNPPLALFFDWLWFDRVPAAGLYVGGAIVFVGIFLCILRPRAPAG